MAPMKRGCSRETLRLPQEMQISKENTHRCIHIFRINTLFEINAEDGLLVQKIHSEHYKRTNSGGVGGKPPLQPTREHVVIIIICVGLITQIQWKCQKKDKNQSPQRCFANSGRPNLEFERFEGFHFRNTQWRILLRVFLHQKYTFLPPAIKWKTTCVD